ncbi:MAG: lytic transglycosylase domain-containing protein [Gemmatimonadales bacterium]
MRDLLSEINREVRPKRRRRSGWLGTLGSLAAATIVLGSLAAILTGLSAAKGPVLVGGEWARDEIAALRQELDDARGKLTLAEAQMDRMTAITGYSALYKVPADLATAIYDIALAEGIHPSLGFQLVKVESGFKGGARSSMNAIGYTQLRLATARFYDSTLTEERLHDRDVNLRIGFRFLKDLMRQFDQDLHLALVAYNRGPTRVIELMERGEDPRNGYSDVVLKGVRRG